MSSGTGTDTETGSYDSDEYSYSSEEEVVPKKQYTKDYKLHVRTFSTTDRAVPDVPMPISKLLTDEEFFLNGLPNAEVIKEHLKGEGRFEPGRKLTKQGEYTRNTSVGS
jgi:hypothetical protein